jgi:hypothetical protein
VEKARAIFRWITVKNLNSILFEDGEQGVDTPMGLLRGIKFGTESYHVLFKRLCRCVHPQTQQLIPKSFHGLGSDPGNRYKNMPQRVALLELVQLNQS